MVKDQGVFSFSGISKYYALIAGVAAVVLYFANTMVNNATIEVKTDARISALEASVANLNNKSPVVDTRLVKLEENMREIRDNQSQINTKLDRIETKLDNRRGR